MNGRISGVFGTQTHVGTLDTKLLPKVTAYLTEVGVTDPKNSVIGSDNILVLERFLTYCPNGLG
ncbi:MAG: hypothetical protein CL721_00895 [Chloroflexi bacterium]|nr:hypothetical protein [Chloroflexota bacterium]